MKKKYYNDAIIGNKNIVASFSQKGEMLRLFNPTRDYRQFIDEMYTGVKVNDSAIIYLHEDINNEYDQYYIENTNILNTKIKNTYFNLSILQTDFVCIEKDILIKKYILKNENTIDLNINFLIYSKLLSDFNNMVGSKVENDVLMQYNHDYTFNIFSKTPILGYRLNNSKEEIKSGIIKDKDYIGMANDAALSFDIGILKPGESKEFEIFIYINDNNKIFKFDEIIEKAKKIRQIDVEKEQKLVEQYWKKYVKEHDTLKILTNQKEWENKVPEYQQTKNIYVRSILLFPLLQNDKTGGISAAIEVDEEKEKSGRYSYCWTRDAVFIAKAFDILNMKNQTELFYTNFCKNTQSKNGMWEQRFYTDGHLAPSWGYQIDETASVVYGIYEHYKQTKNKEFLKKTYPMCQKAIESLRNYLLEKSILFSTSKNNKIERFVTQESYDLWEMNEGIHLYSLSSIYAAFKAMAEIEKELNNVQKVSELEKNAEEIKQYCIENLCNKEENTLKRNNKDNICDISVIGSVIPFNMLDKNQKEVKNSIEKINLNLRTYTGGYIRFQNDSYMGGNNPWVIATLWMALYNIEQNNKEEALKQIEFVNKTATKHGFLAEQIDNQTMKSNWVIGLGWSHAMYIIALSQLGTVPNCDKVAIGDCPQLRKSSNLGQG